MAENRPGIGACATAEFIGTFVLVFLGDGAVHAAVTTGAFSGSWQVACVWGAAVTLAVYIAGGISGAHINPAITCALALSGEFPWRRVLPYVAAQLAGAACAALVLYGCFVGTIEAYERQEGIVRGLPESVVTASMYCEYFPNPTVALHGSGSAGWTNLGIHSAFLIEAVATALLALSAFGLSEPRNMAGPGAKIAPLGIGLTVAVLVAIFGPMTQACLNPARDFGPRAVAYLLGWGEVAFPGPRGAVATLSVYLAAPIVGAAAGGWLHTRLLRRLYRESA